ncbi:MAG: four helix bundle suffix domain-containing protein [Calditrichia bacterium]
MPGSARRVANAALSLLNIYCYLLNRQITRQAGAFQEKSGFTEKLCRKRKNKCNEK